MSPSGSRVSYKAVVAETVSLFWRRTSIAGLSNASSARSSALRVVWLVLSAIAIFATAHDVIRVIHEYLEYPYTTQINLQHKSRVNFPAVTVCNQNRISCWKLQERMLKQLSVSVEGEDSTRLVELYNFTRCGVDGIGCSKVHEIYHRFFSREKGSIPENLANKDVCLHCSTILAEYINMCYVENLQKPPQALTYIWRERDCYSQMKNQNLEFGDQIIQESLDNCFGVPFKTNSSATPSTAETSSKVDPLAVDSQTSTNLDAPGLRVKRQNSRIATELIKTISRDEMSPSEDHDLKMNFLVEYMDLNHQLKKDIGYDFGELIKDCTFMGLKCMDESHFVYSHSPSYGNCYIFNERGNYTTSLTGPTFSLSLVIDAKENTYLPKMLTEKVGARVAVHKPKTQPLMSEEAMDVPPGMSSSIAMKETTLKRLAYPFDANCTSGWNNTEYRYNKDTVYTLTECLNMCLQRLFVDDCGCYLADYPNEFLFSEIQYSRNRTCNLTSTHTDRTCTAKAVLSYSTDVTYGTCGCNVPCSEIHYPSFLSMAKWPPATTLEDVILQYKAQESAEDLLQLNVFYLTMNVDDVIQIPKYDDAWALMSSLGGALSLYMGISIFLLLEVVEFLIHLIVNTYLYARGRYRAPKRDIPQTPSSPSSSDIVFVQRLYSAMGVKESKKQAE